MTATATAAAGEIKLGGDCHDDEQCTVPRSDCQAGKCLCMPFHAVAANGTACLQCEYASHVLSSYIHASFTDRIYYYSHTFGVRLLGERAVLFKGGA